MSTVSIDGYTVTAAELAGLDLTRHDNRVHTIISVNVAFLVVVIFMVSLRTFVRLGFVRHFGWDDGERVLSLHMIHGLIISSHHSYRWSICHGSIHSRFIW